MTLRGKQLGVGHALRSDSSPLPPRERGAVKCLDSQQEWKGFQFLQPGSLGYLFLLQL